jgi:hypothetical protein
VSRRALGLAALVAVAAACVDRPAAPPPYAAVGRRAPPAETFRPGPYAPAPMSSAFIYLPGATRPRQVRYQVQDGMAVYQGDITLGPAHLVPVLYAMPRAGGDGRYNATASSKAHRWPNGDMPYEIDGSVTPEKRAMIDWAVGHVASETVLKPRPRAPADTDYLLFTEAGGEYGCSSYVGRVGGPQKVRVGSCGQRGSVVHEIGHAAGLYHEQSRTDRDNYVTIVWNEISPGEEAQFTVDDDTMDIGAYDYGSIMHYSRGAFSKSGADTIVPKDPNARIGQREGLSVLDKAAIAQLYAGAGGGGAPTPGGAGQPTTIQIPGLPPIPVPTMPGAGGTSPGASPIPGLPLPPGFPAIPGLGAPAPTGAPSGSPPPSQPASPFPGLPAVPGIPSALPPMPSGLPPLPLPQ